MSVLTLVALAFALAQEQPARSVEKVASGFEFTEGPAWDPRNGRLLFSDIPANKIYELRGPEATAVYLDPSEHSNGLLLDRDGNLYVCQHGARRLIRITTDGATEVLADRYDAKRLNSPNDVALDGHGGLYFTDPRYGDDGDVEQDRMAVYYLAADRTLTRVTEALPRPNGILVSRDGGGLYVAEPDLRELWFFPILSPGVLGKGRVLFTGDPELDGGGPDGMAIDEAGNVYTTYAGIVVLRADGTLIERIPVPERPANCGFGGPDGRTLYITARTGLYSVKLERRGQALRPPYGTVVAADPIEPPRFERIVIDDDVGIGYGLAVADMDADGREDIVLVDRDRVAWYRNPDWQEHAITGKLSSRDHVCVAARDLDGDRRAEIVVGAQWNPSDTVGSGSVQYLVRSAGDWRAVKLPHEPTTHRMRWIRSENGHGLIVAPLHGRGNRAGRGAGVRILEYRMPADPTAAWDTVLVDKSMHETHNLDPVAWDADAAEELLLCGREGVVLLDRSPEGWRREVLVSAADGDPFEGASEVRAGRLNGQRFLATVEPFHGNRVVVYLPNEAGSPRRSWRRRVLDESLKQAHAVACGDVCGLGRDQVVVGWRQANAAGAVGIKLFVPLDVSGDRWQTITLDDRTACEDLRIADLDGDGRLDIVAAGRASHDLVVWMQR